MIKVLVTRRLKDYLIFISIETSYELSSVRQRESVTTVEVTLTSDTVTPLLVTLGHPMVDPTLFFIFSMNSVQPCPTKYFEFSLEEY